MRHVRMLGLCLVAVFVVSATTAAGALASGPPTVTEVEPNAVQILPPGDPENAPHIWIHGTGFTSSAKVKIGTSEIPAGKDGGRVTETLIEVVNAPLLPEGEYEVVVEDENGVSTGGPKIKYEPAEKASEAWSKFKNCPLHAEFEGQKATGCTFAQTRTKHGGLYTVGPVTVPVLKSIILQGGLTEEVFEVEGTPEMRADLPPENGASAIVPVAESVPVEVLNNVSEAEMNEAGWPQNLRESYKLAKTKGYFKANKMKEIIEPAGRDHDYVSTFDIVLGAGVGISAKVQIKGENPWLTILGGSCHIGSEAEPIVQHLTSGASTSPLTGEEIHGQPGAPLTFDSGELITVLTSRLVDNTYAVPGAHGCGGSNWESFIDPVVNKAFGLPAPAGASKTVLEGSLSKTTTGNVEKRGL